MIVVDASVFAKLFLDEPEKPEVQAFFRAALEKEVRLVVPSLFVEEVLAVALHYQIAFEIIWEMLEIQQQAGLEVWGTSKSVALKAEEICKTGHHRSGFPSLQGGLYHALAILEDGQFLTADKRHYEKARSFGHIVLLKDWQKLRLG
jgi:predicted nucleic acid-binding protein